MTATDEAVTSATESTETVAESTEEETVDLTAFETAIDAALAEKDQPVLADLGAGKSYLGFILHHTVHHRGQLSMYLRPMGAKVPSIYGESWDAAEARKAAQA